MTEGIKTDKKQPVKAPTASEDLSKAIEQSVERQHDEQVKSVRLFDDLYRCNWWVLDKAPTARGCSVSTICIASWSVNCASDIVPP